MARQRIRAPIRPVRLSVSSSGFNSGVLGVLGGPEGRRREAAPSGRKAAARGLYNVPKFFWSANSVVCERHTLSLWL